MRRRGAAMVTIALLIAPWLSTSSRTRAAATEVVVEYEAHAGCPDRATFVEAVGARAPDVRVVSAKPGVRTLRVRIVAAGKKSRGTVDAVDANGASTTVRSLVGERCEDVAQALSIIVALAIAPGGGEPASSSVTASSASGAPNATSSGPTPATSIEPTTSATTSPEGRWHWGAAVGDRLRLGVTPRPANGPELTVALSSPSELVRLGLGVDVGFDPAWGGDADARFRLVAAHATLCLALGEEGVGRFFAGCAGFEAGTLRGEGVSIAHPSAATGTWLAIDLGPSIRVPLGRALALAATGGAAFPLLHPRFVFETPRSVVHETPKVTGFFGLSLAVRFL